MPALNILFMGTPDFAVPCLKALLQSQHNVVAVVSQPDRKVGRGRKLAKPPVAALAVESNCPLFQWDRLSSESYETLREFPIDLAVVVAYGKILPQRYLDLPTHGCLNVHSSLLPKWRGAAPIQWAVINGDVLSGVTIMKLDAGMDTGDVAAQRQIAIGPNMTAGTLHDQLSVMGADVLLEVVNSIAEGHARFTPQDHSQATHARRLEKRDGAVNWDQDNALVHNHIRGMHPWPGAYIPSEFGPIKIHSSILCLNTGTPGTIIEITSDGPVLACRSGSVCLTQVQRPGKKTVSGGEFVRAYNLTVGHTIEQALS